MALPIKQRVDGSLSGFTYEDGTGFRADATSDPHKKWTKEEAEHILWCLYEAHHETTWPSVAGDDASDKVVKRTIAMDDIADLVGTKSDLTLAPEVLGRSTAATMSDALYSAIQDAYDDIDEPNPSESRPGRIALPPGPPWPGQSFPGRDGLTRRGLRGLSPFATLE